jgi:DNA ligase 1
MQSDDIFDIVEEIAAESSRSGKEALLEAAFIHPGFVKVVAYTYDPFKQFHMRRAVLTDSGTESFSDITWGILDDLEEGSLSGDAAYKAVQDELAVLSSKSAKLFLRILDKNLECGIAVKTINKAAGSKLIPDMPYMRCSLPSRGTLKDFDWDGRVISQEKMDGMYGAISSASEGLLLQSRQGQVFKHVPAVDAMDLQIPAGLQAQGEMLVAIGDKLLPRKEGNGILNSWLKLGVFPEGYRLHFIAWDLVPLPHLELGIFEVEYRHRFATLCDTTNLDVVETRWVYSYEEALKHFHEVVARGGEGTIVKDRKAIWKNHVSPLQVKVKQERQCEVRIIDRNLGTGKNKDTFGSLLCVSEDGELSVNVGGFSDAERLEIHNNWDDWEMAIITVTFERTIKDKTGETSLAHPRYEERRLDKSEADTLEIIEGI